MLYQLSYSHHGIAVIPCDYGQSMGTTGALGGNLSTLYTLFNYLFLQIYTVKIPASTITQIYCITVSTHTVSQLLLIKTFFLQCLQITIRTVQGITALTEKHFSAVSKSVSFTQYTDQLLKCSSPRLMEQGLGKTKRHFFSSSTSSQHFHFRVRLLTAHTQQCMH